MAHHHHDDPDRVIGYAVVGLGWISQVATLPAFRNARRNSRLVALVSGEEEKRRRLADRYDLRQDATYHYDDYDACLARDDVDAVYIGLPNHLHRDYTVRAAERGVHVLCEKPMAVTADECTAMIDACRHHDVRLMIAYRLHFDAANMRAVELVRDGRIGEPRAFSAAFTQQVQEGDIRLAPVERGGGPLYDIGIYCLNAARYLFGAEPVQGWATQATRPEPRFAEVEETISCVLRFPGERLATFTCSFGAAPVSVFHVVGSDGDLTLTNAFNFVGERELRGRGDRDERETFPTADQFGPQLLYFSDCVLEGRAPEPDGEEGLVDVRIIRALYEALESGRPVDIEVSRARRPGPEQVIRCPPVEQPELVNADAPGE